MLIAACDVSAQLDGRLYLDKTTYLVGEPIYLNFELANKGSDVVQFLSGNSYSFCSGYRIEVAPVPAVSSESCNPRGFGGSCAAGTWVVEPGETRNDKILLNYDHDLSTPGLYTIHATRALSYGPVTDSIPNTANEPEIKVEAELQIQLVDVGDESALVPIFQPFVADLDSKDEQRQREAARAIGSLAPPFLEDKIISMLNSPVTRPFALLGLRRLNTSRSREALAKVVRDSPKDSHSYDRFQALKYPSEMSDKSICHYCSTKRRSSSRIRGRRTWWRPRNWEERTPYRFLFPCWGVPIHSLTPTLSRRCRRRVLVTLHLC